MKKIEELEEELKELKESREKIVNHLEIVSKICKEEYETMLPPVQTCINDLTKMLNETTAKLKENIKQYYYLKARIDHINDLINSCTNVGNEWDGLIQPSLIHDADAKLWDIDLKIEKITKAINKLKN